MEIFNYLVVNLIYLNIQFLVPGIKSNVNNKVSGFVPLFYMYLIDTKFETFFFNLGLIPGTINGVLRWYLVEAFIFLVENFLFYSVRFNFILLLNFVQATKPEK